MMTNRDKGVRNEQNAATLYREAGFRVERAPAGRFTNADWFDLADLMCWRDTELRFVQVKSNGARGIREWLDGANQLQRVPGVVCEYAIRYDSAGWRVVRPHGDTYQTLYDERKDDRVGPHRDTPKRLGEGLVEWLREHRGGSSA